MCFAVVMRQPVAQCPTLKTPLPKVVVNVGSVDEGSSLTQVAM